MVVREDKGTLLLITQPDHAAAAATIMSAWQADGLPSRPTRAAALFATEHHDIGWTEFDAAPVVNPETGRPFDFIGAPIATRHAVWRRALEVLPASSTYGAALVAQHALTIYRRFRGDSAWHAFFDEMEHGRDRWFTTETRPDGTSGGALDPRVAERRTFLQDYTVVRTGDLLSLTFCNAWTTREQAEGYEVVLHGRELHVTPDPFGGAPVPFRVRARRVPDRAYASDEELRRAVADAPVEWLEGVAIGREELAIA